MTLRNINETHGRQSDITTTTPIWSATSEWDADCSRSWWVWSGQLHFPVAAVMNLADQITLSRTWQSRSFSVSSYTTVIISGPQCTCILGIPSNRNRNMGVQFVCRNWYSVSLTPSFGLSAKPIQKAGQWQCKIYFIIYWGLPAAFPWWRSFILPSNFVQYLCPLEQLWTKVE